MAAADYSCAISIRQGSRPPRKRCAYLQDAANPLMRSTAICMPQVTRLARRPSSHSEGRPSAIHVTQLSAAALTCQLRNWWVTSSSCEAVCMFSARESPADTATKVWPPGLPSLPDNIVTSDLSWSTCPPCIPVQHLQ